MDVKQAKIDLANAIKVQSGNVDALKLALSILDDTYRADLTALEVAQTEANTKSLELSAKVEALRIEKEEKATQIARAEVAETKVVEKEEVIATLSETKAKLEKDLEDLTVSKKTATDALANVVNVISDALVKATPVVETTLPVEEVIN